MSALPPALTERAIALAVADLERMAQWYCSVLGARETARGEFPAVGAAYVMLELGGRALELISRPATAMVMPDRTAPPDHLSQLGWKALVFDAGDLNPWNRWLAKHSAEIVWQNVELAPGEVSTMIRDPEGNLVNLFGTTA